VSQHEQPDRVVLLGMMGAGKTTTGRALAERLGWQRWDSDEAIAAHVGATGAEIAARDGVEALHDLEAQLFLAALEGPQPTVLSPAASVVDVARCRAALQTCTLVAWLEAPIELLVERKADGDHRRPMDPAVAAASLDRRHRRFVEVADLRLAATEPTTELVETVVTELARRGSDPIRAQR
jgi:shikimate kinase